MVRTRKITSISTPILLASAAVSLNVILLVGWVVLLVRNWGQTADTSVDVGWLIVGAISFVAIIIVIVMFAIYLAREILEVRRQDSFIDSVTHELKSPLASIKLGLETLGRLKRDDEQKESLREMMLDDVERLTALIDSVLQVTRITTSRPQLNFTSVNVREQVARSIGRVTKRRRLDTDIVKLDAPGGLTVFSDPFALDLIVENLLDNAIKYSGAQPKVSVDVRCVDDNTVWRVRDQGIGIDPRHLGRVFDRFYRVADEDTRRRAGTGLGLFVTSALVRSLGGTIVARSQGKGHGSEFELNLPHRAVPTQGADAQQNAATHQSEGLTKVHGAAS